MMVLAAFLALALTASAGFYCGRCVGPASLSWQKRTSRVALGKRTVSLLVLVGVRRLRRRLRANPTVELAALRMLVPLGLLRGSVTRMRSYRGAPGW